LEAKLIAIQDMEMTTTMKVPIVEHVRQENLVKLMALDGGGVIRVQNQHILTQHLQQHARLVISENMLTVVNI
jgi:hypothetical protein